jgi:hypothetical protein
MARPITTHVHRPIPVSAIQWTGSNFDAVAAWLAPRSARLGTYFPPLGQFLISSGPTSDTAEPSTLAALPGSWLWRLTDFPDSDVHVTSHDAFIAMMKPAHP